jgi:hypothetical protein
MMLQDQIATFLKSKIKWPHCDDCIREQVSPASIDDVRRETENMKSQLGFLPTDGICTRCGHHKPTIMAM